MNRADPPPIVMLALALLLTGCGAYDQVTDNSPSAQRNDSLLSLFSGPSPTQAAAWAIDDLSADNRYRGTVILANAPYAGQEVYLELFRDNMNPAREPYAIVRGAAVRGLAHHGSPEDVPRLLEALETEESTAVRAEIVRALQRIHAPEAVSPLIALLRDIDDEPPQIRAEAANALGQYPEQRVLDALVLALRDDSLLVNERALQSLNTLTGEDFGDDDAAWFDWRDDAPRPFVERSRYIYPIFERGPKYYEWLPLVPDPPNEVASTPVGFPEPDIILEQFEFQDEGDTPGEG